MRFDPHSWTALVTLAALLLYVWFGVGVGRARGKHGLHAPAMHGNELVERHIRVHLNMLEWFPLFLVPLWLFAIYWNDRLAALIGVVWIVGRLLYGVAYVRDPGKRELGFLIQAVACLVLLIGAAVGAVRMLLATGGM